MKSRNVKKLREQKEELAKVIDELEKQQDLREADKKLLNELRTLHSKITNEEIKSGKIVKDNKQKERDLDRLSSKKLISTLSNILLIIIFGIIPSASAS